MRTILIRLLVAAALTLAAFVLSSSARGQQAGSLVLADPVSKMSCPWGDQVHATRFVDHAAKVIGKLPMRGNTIHIDTINPAP